MEQQKLRSVGLKVTLPRLKILQILEASAGRHMSAEDVYKTLLNSKEDVGLATVYRVLTQFEEAGIASRHNFDDGRSVFELACSTHHDHMVCIDTGKVVEFVSEDIEKLQKEIADKHGYEIIDHKLVMYVRAKEGALEK